jgi:hypothetical protein
MNQNIGRPLASQTAAESRPILRFRGTATASDRGLLGYRELDKAPAR